MLRIPSSFVVAFVIGGTAAVASADPGPMVLWYDRPAEKWVEALPIGNGRLGAMVFGGTENERIQFNEDTLWVGRPHDYSHPGAAEHLPTLRTLLFEGKQSEAERLAMQHFMSVPLRQMAYQPFGDVKLHFPGHDQATGYRHQLDIDQAVATTTYRVDGVTFTREVFSSYPDNVIVVHITADKPGQVSFTARLESPQPGASRAAVNKHQLAIRGDLTSEGHPSGKKPNCMKYEARLIVDTDGGQAHLSDKAVGVSGADAATLLLAAATNYVNCKDVSADPAACCQRAISAVVDKAYDAMRAAHVADHQVLFRRVVLDLGTTDAVNQSTEKRLRAFGPQDPQLAALYFQFGRYLMIAGSRPGTQPLTLQGIWNESLAPPWESKYTININTEMNYWPAEICNLAECAEPLFDALDELAVTGAKVAKAHYNARGWVCHHNFDLWRGAAPINHSNHGIWPTGGAWLCQNLWWHYEFSRDRAFLARRAYSVMKHAALFFVDYLIEDPRNDKGWLISGPSNSPEQGGLVIGPTMDHQIIRDLFGNVIEASKILGVDAAFRQTLIEKRAKIAPNQIGRHGQLQEWLEDVDRPDNRHRHLSHLFGLHPGNEITPRGTPELFKAARQSLVFRGDGATGWSKAWKANLWARCEDRDPPYLLLRGLITGSTFPNMFDAHPPFQIDGNFGGTSGITEMLLQSHAGEIALLPALPGAWKTGSVKGLRARGGVEVDIAWEDGQAIGARLKTKAAATLRIRAPRDQQITAVLNAEGESVPLTADGVGAMLEAPAGAIYRLRFD